MERKPTEIPAEHVSPEPIEHGDLGRLKTLDINTVRELWSKTYNADGKPDWSHIYPYYHPDVVFQDSIQRIEGIEEFVALCERLTQRCESIHMEILAIAQDSNTILMDWIMTMAFTKYPPTPMYGSTKLTLHEDGRIIAQRDYFDLWGDIFDGIPVLQETAIAGSCAKSSARGRRMTRSRLPDELMFIENRRASQKTTTASLAGKALRRLRGNLGRGAGSRQASGRRRRPDRHALPEP